MRPRNVPADANPVEGFFGQIREVGEVMVQRGEKLALLFGLGFATQDRAFGRLISKLFEMHLHVSHVSPPRNTRTDVLVRTTTENGIILKKGARKFKEREPQPATERERQAGARERGRP